MADYTSLINRIESRYNPDSLREVRLNSISSLSGIDKDIAKYVKLAMNEVDPIYTNKMRNYIYKENYSRVSIFGIRVP